VSNYTIRDIINDGKKRLKSYNDALGADKSFTTYKNDLWVDDKQQAGRKIAEAFRKMKLRKEIERRINNKKMKPIENRLVVVPIVKKVGKENFTSTNPYEVLGVNSKSTMTQIKTAYKKLSLKYHPDKTRGDDKIFKKILKAYTFLTKNHVDNDIFTKMAEWEKSITPVQDHNAQLDKLLNGKGLSKAKRSAYLAEKKINDEYIKSALSSLVKLIDDTKNDLSKEEKDLVNAKMQEMFKSAYKKV
jgi:hypothetical protein